jgi:DNA-binding winged helix-turn-helix (wHTH) protein/tetratricopeptide (TPR) repeat protein
VDVVGTEAPVLPERVYRFGLFQFDPHAGHLQRQGRPVKLHGQPLQVLHRLLLRPGEIVTREELQRSLWPDGTYVEFDTSLNATLKRLRFALGDDAENPVFIETVPRHGYRFIAPVEIREATIARDTQAADQLPATMESPEQVVPVVRGARFRYYAMGLAVIVVAGTTVVLLSHRAKPGLQARTSTQVVEAATRRSVAIMEFANASGHADSAWLSTAIPEMLSTELAAGDKLRLIPGDEVARMKRDLQLDNSGTLARDTAVRAGKNLNANLLVTGSFVAMGTASNPRLRIDLRLQDARNGEEIAELAEPGTENGLFELVSQSGMHLRQRLGMPSVSPNEEPSLRASVPSNAEAARLYAEGLARLRAWDAAAARDLLQHAIAAEPGFPLSHSALASAWKILGYDQNARAEAKKAFDLSANLPRADRLLIEGRYHEMSAETDQAISAYRALFALFPDSVDNGLLLANVQILSGKPNEALDTINALYRLPKPLSDDPRTDIAESFAFGALGDNRQAIEAKRRARKKAELQGSPLLAASADQGTCWLLNTAGQPDDAMRLCQATLPVFAQAGDRAGMALSIRYIGDIESGQGKLAEAMDSYRRSLQIEQETGHNPAGIFNQMAIVQEMQGNLKDAEILYRDSYKFFSEAGDRKTAAVVQGNVGDTLIEQGKLAEAEKLFQQSLSTASEVGAKDSEAAAHDNLSWVALLRGQLNTARQHAEQAVTMHREAGQTYELSFSLTQLANVLRAQGDLAQARQQGTEALAVAEKREAKVPAAEAQLSLAEMDLDEGQASQAEPAIRDALLVFRNQKMRDDELHALTVLARCLLVQNKLTDAEAAVAEAREIALHSQNPQSHMLFAIADARVKAGRAMDSKSAGALNEARSELQKAIGTARRLGFGEMEYEAHLAVAEIQRKASPAIGKAYSASLAKDAHAHGFELIARKAGALY